MTGTNMCDKPLAGYYGPFAADHPRGAGLGRRLARSLGCHAQVIQLPSIAPVPELGQASLAVTLVGSPMASRFASQAPASNAGVLDLSVDYFVNLHHCALVDAMMPLRMRGISSCL
jgi:hypothetical protein